MAAIAAAAATAATHDHHPQTSPKRFEARSQKSSQEQELCARKRATIKYVVCMEI